MCSKTSRKERFDEECRLAIQENNKGGEKVTECNTEITCRRIYNKRKCTKPFK